jgi:undecaprenyl-diphosphatase
VLFRSQRLPRLLPYALIWAASIALSQVYVGVHYPFDVICGAITGSIFGYFASVLVRKKLVVIK